MSNIDTDKQLALKQRKDAYVQAAKKCHSIELYYCDTLRHMRHSYSATGPFVSGQQILREIEEARRAMKLACCAFEVASGKLPSNPYWPHTVPLDCDAKCLDINIAIDRIATGGHSIWYNDDGYCFISFEEQGDAEMFLLALEGGAR